MESVFMQLLLLRLLVLITLCGVGFSCKEPYSPIPHMNEQAFHAYWFQGKAEISSFELNQSRYGANHDGTVVMIFVTEDFSRSRHVKLDDPSKHPSDAVKVMKLNMHSEFITGIYKYSMMSSVFMPLDYNHFPHSLKLTASSQDWCGQSFMQADWKGNRYEIQHMTYFESTGDARYSLVNTWLEDEVWTRIRVAPHTLPLGQVKMIASAFFIRLHHIENKVYEAATTLLTLPDRYRYTIIYPELKRTLEIDFKKSFPYTIEKWKETINTNEVTTGRLLKTIQSDYWLRNTPGDEILRNQLNLKN